MALDKACRSEFCHCSTERYRGRLTGIGTFEYSLSAIGAPGIVGDVGIGDEGVVPIHIAVVVGNGEEELVLVDLLARKMLQHHAHAVRILHQGYGIEVRAFGVGEHLRGEITVEEAVDVGVDKSRTVGGTMGGEPAGEACTLQCGGYAEGAPVGSAAPYKEVVGTGLHIHLHRIVFGSKRLAGFGLLMDDVPPGVEEPERHGADLVGKSVGVLHVHVVAEPDAIVYGAVALIVVDETVARRKDSPNHSPYGGNGSKPEGKMSETMH